MTIKPGVELLAESLGEGPPVERHKHYRVRLRMWLRGGDPVRWETLEHSQGDEAGDETTLIRDTRVDRVSLIAGLFYGIQGMRVGGTRTLRIAPHLAYGERGLPGRVPANAVLTVEIRVLSERPALNY